MWYFGAGQLSAVEMQMELLNWIKAHGRRPLEKSQPLTKAEEEEQRMAKRLRRLRSKAKERDLPADLVQELNQVRKRRRRQAHHTTSIGRRSSTRSGSP